MAPVPRAVARFGPIDGLAVQALMAFAPKLEAARLEQGAVLVEALLMAVAYHQVSKRSGVGGRGRGSEGPSQASG
jgi:hypothetical protein